MSQTQAGASSSTATRGGTNANASRAWFNNGGNRYNPWSGSLQDTGRGLDLAIQGEGFFMVADSSARTC